MITLNEAIVHCEQKYREQEKNGCNECAADHKQLYDWLVELRKWRDTCCKDESIDFR
jgi:hypothetical protein